MNTDDELRAMLDERGVNWDYGITGAATTKFRANGVDLTFMSMRDGLVCTTILTPAQVIAATLGESMTNTEKAALERRIDELCAEVERLRKANDTIHGDAFEIGAMLVKARDENAKLREQVSMWRACREDETKRCDRADAEVERLSAENAKLREYAAKAWSLFIRHGAVHACDLSEVDAVRDGLRELGVEVPE